MYDTVRDLLDAFQSSPDSLAALLGGHSEAETRAPRGGDENWSVVEVVCHLRDAEERAIERMRKMRDEDNPFLAAYNQERWAVERNYASEPIRDALSQFLNLRTQHLDELRALSPAAWERTGQHEEQGQITIASQTLHLVCHDAIHLAQIARQLATQRQTD